MNEYKDNPIFKDFDDKTHVMEDWDWLSKHTKHMFSITVHVFDGEINRYQIYCCNNCKEMFVFQCYEKPERFMTTIPFEGKKKENKPCL